MLFFYPTLKMAVDWKNIRDKVPGSGSAIDDCRMESRMYNVVRRLRGLMCRVRLRTPKALISKGFGGGDPHPGGVRQPGSWWGVRPEKKRIDFVKKTSRINETVDWSEMFKIQDWYWTNCNARFFRGQWAMNNAKLKSFNLMAVI